jgi:mutator protein MutT
MKKIEVVAAVIIKSGLFLGVKRKATALSNPGKWEFPGGKVEVGETLEVAMMREVKEELNLEIKVLTALHYQQFTEGELEIQLHYLLCRVDDFFSMKLNEHEQVQWFSLRNFAKNDWLPGDEKIPQLLKTKNLLEN